MAVNLTAKVIELLKMAGIDYSKMAGKIDPNKVKQLVTKTQKTVTKPKLIDALVKDKATFSDALKIFEDEAQYISQMNEMELANFANNLDDYFKAGGKKKNIPTDNVVTTEGTPVVGKQFEKLAERKGAKGEPDDSLQGSMQGLASLIDEIKGISPKLRNQMDRNELAKFIQKMRGKKFTNEEIKWVKAEMDEWGIGSAKEKATGMQYGKKLGAKNKDEFEFVNEYVETLNTYSPKEFKEIYGNVKHVNMDISNIIDSKLEKHFKKKYKWDDTKKDGGLDDKTYEMYEDELYQTQKDFGDFHTIYDSGPTNMFGMRKGKSWANHPNNYLDEASEKFESITGQGLNVDFLKSYTDDVLSKYPEPEKFQYGGPVVKGPDMGSTAHGSSELASRQRVLQPGGQMTTSTGLNYLLGEDDNNRIPFNQGMIVPPEKPRALMMLDKLNSKAALNTLGPQFMFNMVAKYATEAKEKGDISERQYMEIMQPFFGKGGETITRKIDEEREYLDKYADGGRIPFQGGGSDASTESFSKSFDKMHGTDTVKTSRPDPVEGPDDRSSPEQTLAHIQYQKNITKDPHDKAIDYIDKANQGWKAWNMLNAGSIGGAAKAAFSFNPYAWAGAGLIGLDKRRKKKKLEEMQKSLTYADGGRIGFSLGGMGRRGFLKFLGGTAAGIAAMKAGIVKLLGGPTTKKSIAKGITIPKTGGMPDWFEPLVNKVIREGEDVTKKFATKEREIVHRVNLEGTAQQGKKFETYDDSVYVYQDLDDGAVRVEYNSADNLAEGPVELQFKPGVADETTKGKPPDEFTASEAEPEIVNWDGDIEWTGENFADDVKGLSSDTTKLKEYAVGKNKVTVKEIVESIKKKKRTQKINENTTEQINYIEEKHGPAMDYIEEGARVGEFDSKGYRNYDTKGMNLPEKKAFGGRIGFAGGRGLKALIEIASRIGLNFNQATDVQKQIIQKYGNRIDDKLLDYMIYDPNAQRQAEVMASIDEAEIMINKGMSPDDVIAAQKKSFRTKNASGGLAGMLGE